MTRSARSRKGQTRCRSSLMPSATGRSGAKRMAPPRLGVAPLQQLVVAIEEHHVEIEIVLGDQALERLDQRRDGEIARPHVDARPPAARRVACGPTRFGSSDSGRLSTAS